MAETAKIEKFSANELGSLRSELIEGKMDSWQVAELIASFLAGRGYGVDTTVMRSVVPRLDFLGGSPEVMQSVLETVAFVM